MDTSHEVVILVTLGVMYLFGIICYEMGKSKGTEQTANLYRKMNNKDNQEQYGKTLYKKETAASSTKRRPPLVMYQEGVFPIDELFEQNEKQFSAAVTRDDEEQYNNTQQNKKTTKTKTSKTTK